LAVVAAAHLASGKLRNGVSPVGGLQRSAQ
jgi:hypothetical protein